MDGAFSEITISSVPVDNNIIQQGHVLGDWFIFRDERHFGPLTSKQVRRFLTKKMISSEHHIWRPGFTGWKAIKDIEGFRSHGRAKIRELSDDEFSFRARLKSIDRISLEAKDLEFLEKEEGEDVQEEPLTFMSAVHKAVDFIGFTEEGTNYPRVFVTSVIFSALIGFVIFFNKADSYPFLESMAPEIKAKLLEVSAMKESTRDPNFVIFEKEYEVSDPVLVAATNLPVGSRIKINIQGEPETLLGSYRFSKTTETRLKSKIFLSDAIREESGKYISPGSYTVTAHCLSCSASKNEVYKSTFMFGVKDQVLYQKELKRFHLETRQNAQLELSELKDLHRTLDRQYQNSINQFVLYSAKKNKSGWNKFSTVWLNNQKKFIDLFEQMNSEKFMRKLYYLPLYEAYDHLILQLFELHLIQDGIINVTSDVNDGSKNVSKLSQEVSLRLTTLRSQVDLMEMNFSKTSGLPSQEGLRLNNNN